MVNPRGAAGVPDKPAEKFQVLHPDLELLFQLAANRPQRLFTRQDVPSRRARPVTRKRYPGLVVTQLTEDSKIIRSDDAAGEPR